MTRDERVVESIRHMTKHVTAMTDVTKSGNEFYFRFKDHLFSIMQRSESHEWGEYSFFVYPLWTGSIANLIQEFEYNGTENVEMVSFHVNAMDASDAKAAMRDLYFALNAQRSDIDAILDDVLGVSAE